MRFPTMWYVRPAKAQISLRIRAVWSEPLQVAWIFYECKATDRTLFRVSKLKGSSESTLVKMPHRWKAHVAAHVLNSWTMGSMSHLLSIRYCHTGICVLVLFLCQVLRLNLRDESSKCLNGDVLVKDWSIMWRDCTCESIGTRKSSYSFHKLTRPKFLQFNSFAGVLK